MCKTWVRGTMRLFLALAAAVLIMSAARADNGATYLNNLYSSCVPSCTQRADVGRDWCSRYCQCVVDRIERAHFAQEPLAKMRDDDPVNDLDALSALEAGTQRNMQRLARVCAKSTPR